MYRSEEAMQQPVVSIVEHVRRSCMRVCGQDETIMKQIRHCRI